jgi:fimbrial chaperone protein
MIMREVPEATAVKANTMEVPIALALSMPVFITPPSAKHQLHCQAARHQAEIQVVCENKGTAYAQLREIQVKRQEQSLAKLEGGIYILPGAQKTLSLKAEQPITTGQAQLSIMFDNGKNQLFDIELF